MAQNKYHLVNPYIDGSFKTSVKAQNSQVAANVLYKKLSEHFNNSVESFHFTIQKGTSESGKLYHFEVNEKREENEVSFTIKPMVIKGASELESKFKTKLDKFKTKLEQEGGKKNKKSKSKSKKSKIEDSSDSDLSSSSDYRRAKSYVPMNQPIYYWWYDPYVYRLDSVFIPNFYSYSIPVRTELALYIL